MNTLYNLSREGELSKKSFLTLTSNDGTPPVIQFLMDACRNLESGNQDN